MMSLVVVLGLVLVSVKLVAVEVVEAMDFAVVEVKEAVNTVEADVAKESALSEIKALCDNAMLMVEQAAFNCDTAFEFSCAVGKLNIWSLGMDAFAIHNKAHTNALSYERDYKHLIDAVNVRVTELRAIYA